jgi:hypothetical protein
MAAVIGEYVPPLPTMYVRRVADAEAGLPANTLSPIAQGNLGFAPKCGGRSLLRPHFSFF